MKNTYVQAITQLITAGGEIDHILSRAKIVMVVRGHGRLYGDVLKDVVIALETKLVMDTPTIIIARKNDSSTLEVKEVLALLDCSNIKPTIKVDDTIIGGVIATRGSTHIDMSYKSILQKLYQAVTT